MILASLTVLPKVFDLADVMMAFWLGGCVAIIWLHTKTHKGPRVGMAVVVVLVVLFTLMVTLAYRLFGGYR